MEHAPGSLSRGVFTISIDTELAWGCFDRTDREERWRLEARSRDVIQRLLALFAEYGVSATWATVGHLFLDQCESVDGETHSDIPRPHALGSSEDWYRYDPGGDAASAPLWYAPDIIQQLLDAQPQQEIASHSFSHPNFSHPNCSAEAAAADIAACVESAALWGIKLESFVYPRNRIAHIDALVQNGFRCYRGEDPAWFASLPSLPRRLAHYLDDLLALPPPTVHPKREGVLWNIPGSMMLQGRDGIRRYIPTACRTRRCVAGLDRASKRHEIFHLWFHPINFAVDIEAMIGALEPVLRKAAALREKGEIEILTMAAIARRLTDTCQEVNTLPSATL